MSSRYIKFLMRGRNYLGESGRNSSSEKPIFECIVSIRLQTANIHQVFDSQFRSYVKRRPRNNKEFSIR